MGVVTRLHTEQSGVEIPARACDLIFSRKSTLALGHCRPPSECISEASRWGMRLITYLHIMPTLWESGAMRTLSLCGFVACTWTALLF